MVVPAAVRGVLHELRVGRDRAGGLQPILQAEVRPVVVHEVVRVGVVLAGVAAFGHAVAAVVVDDVVGELHVVGGAVVGVVLVRADPRAHVVVEERVVHDRQVVGVVPQVDADTRVVVHEVVGDGARGAVVDRVHEAAVRPGRTDVEDLVVLDRHVGAAAVAVGVDAGAAGAAQVVPDVVHLRVLDDRVAAGGVEPDAEGRAGHVEPVDGDVGPAVAPGHVGAARRGDDLGAVLGVGHVGHAVGRGREAALVGARRHMHRGAFAGRLRCLRDGAEGRILGAVSGIRAGGRNVKVSHGLTSPLIHSLCANFEAAVAGARPAHAGPVGRSCPTGGAGRFRGPGLAGMDWSVAPVRCPADECRQVWGRNGMSVPVAIAGNSCLLSQKGAPCRCTARLAGCGEGRSGAVQRAPFVRTA